MHLSGLFSFLRTASTVRDEGAPKRAETGHAAGFSGALAAALGLGRSRGLSRPDEEAQDSAIVLHALAPQDPMSGLPGTEGATAGTRSPHDAAPDRSGETNQSKAVDGETTAGADRARSGGPSESPSSTVDSFPDAPADDEPSLETFDRSSSAAGDADRATTSSASAGEASTIPNTDSQSDAPSEVGEADRPTAASALSDELTGSARSRSRETEVARQRPPGAETASTMPREQQAAGRPRAADPQEEDPASTGRARPSTAISSEALSSSSDPATAHDAAREEQAGPRAARPASAEWTPQDPPSEASHEAPPESTPQAASSSPAPSSAEADGTSAVAYTARAPEPGSDDVPHTQAARPPEEPSTVLPQDGSDAGAAVRSLDDATPRSSALRDSGETDGKGAKVSLASSDQGSFSQTPSDTSSGSNPRRSNAAPEPLMNASSSHFKSAVEDVPIDELAANPEMPADERAFSPEQKATASSLHSVETLQGSSRSRPPGSMLWLRSILAQSTRSLDLAQGWKAIEVQLDEGLGTMVVRARRGDDGVAVSVSFSDPNLRSLAEHNVQRLQDALRAEYETNVDLSFMSDGSSGSPARRDPSDRGRTSTATRLRAGMAVEASADAPASHRPTVPGVRNEWIG